MGCRWYEARRDPTRLAPDPATTPEAVIQVYAARAVSWRGVFSMHTWIAVKPSGALLYARYEMLGFGVAKGSVWWRGGEWKCRCRYGASSGGRSERRRGF